MQRRTFVQLILAALPFTRLHAQAATANPPATAVLIPGPKPALVPAGNDREGKKRSVGVSDTSYKVLTAETAGAMFVMEQSNRKHGGPPRHRHFSQDELFYVMEGTYVVEVGDQRFRLGPGDCVLGPRNVPHAWAFVGDTTGRMLLSYSPAGRMEEFFSNREQLGFKPGTYSHTSDNDTMRAYGMENVGPPIKLES